MSLSTDKYLFVDVETTGTSPERHGLTQLSGCVQVGDDVKEYFDYFIRPFREDVIEEEALKVTGFDRRQFLPENDPNCLKVDGQVFADPFETFASFKELLARYVDPYNKSDKLQFVGYNSHSFDMPFLRRFWEKNNDRFFGSWFWYPGLDVMLIWAQLLKDERGQLPNFKLATVAKHCGIEVEEDRLHDSRYDIDLTRELWLLACDRMRGARPATEPAVQGSLFDF